MAEGKISEEEVKQLKEKLSKMSPEELRQFQKQQCIFCQIISGKVASKKIYEDNVCLAILDINPGNPGHILLMPKEHYVIMPMIPEEELKHLSMVAKALSHILLKNLKVQGTTIFIANGAAAGQRAQHFMMHIIPRKENDGLSLDIPVSEISDEEIQESRIKILEKVNELLKPEIKIKAEPMPKKEKPANKQEKPAADIFSKVEKIRPEIKEAEFTEEETEEEAKPAKKEVKHEMPAPKSVHPQTPKPDEAKQKEKRKGGASLDEIAALFK